MPDGPPPPPVVQRLRLRYAKRGRLRFVSHRDFARALERALRRAGVPMAYSAGFNPHPRISYVGAAPTGAASEAEYVEIALAQVVAPESLRRALDAVLPAGLDIVDAVVAGPGSLPDRIDASHWRLELPGVAVEQLRDAVAAFLAEPAVPVERLTKNGRRTTDARGPVERLEVLGSAAGTGVGGGCATLDLVVRHVTPAVRPDDVLSGLRSVADLAPPEPSRATRLAQGTLSAGGRISDPLAADRETGTGAPPSSDGSVDKASAHRDSGVPLTDTIHL